MQQGLQSYLDAMVCIKTFRFRLMGVCRQVLRDHVDDLTRLTKQKFDTKRLSLSADPYGRATDSDEKWNGSDAWLGAALRPTQSSKIDEIHLSVWWGREDDGAVVSAYACAFLYFRGKTEAEELYKKWEKIGAEQDDYGIGFFEEIRLEQSGLSEDGIKKSLVKVIKKLSNRGKEVHDVLRNRRGQ